MFDPAPSEETFCFTIVLALFLLFFFFFPFCRVVNYYRQPVITTLTP